MTRNNPLPVIALRKAERGSTLLEVAIATVVIAIVSLAGTSYYLYARMFEIHAQQDQAAFNIVELEIESWVSEGYGASGGFTTTSIPFGYNYTWGAADPRRVNYPRLETREGMTYRVTATLLWNLRGAAADGYSNNIDFRWQDTVAGVSWQYRRIQMLVEWGPGFGSNLTVETRISQ